MIKTITLEQAIIDCPAIDCSMPSIEVSDKYKLISTKNLLEKAINDGWKIFETYQIGKSVTTQHYVLIAHDVVLNNDVVSKQGIPFICICNSHNGKQRFNYILGYQFNGVKLFTENAYMESCDINHKKHDQDEIFVKLNGTKAYVRSFLETISTIKQRILSAEEIKTFELYSFRLTKKNMKFNYTNEISLWNIVEDFHKQIKFSLNKQIKYSQIFWKAICASMIFQEENLKTFLIKQ